MLWQLLLLAAALGAAYYRWSRRRLHRLAREIPSGLKEYPIIGHAYMAIGSSEDRMEALQRFGRIANRQNGLSSVWLSSRLFICTTDPETIDVVSKTCLDKDEFTLKFVRTVIGNGLIFAPVNIWRPRRKIMAPFFNLKNLMHLVPVFHKKSSLLVDLLGSEVGNGDFSIWKYMTTYSFDVVSETAMGTKMDSQINSDHFVLRAINELIHMVSKRMLQPWLHPDFVYERLPVYKQFHSIRQSCWDFADEIIQLKRKEHAAKPKNSQDYWTTFTEMIIQSHGGKEGYSDIEIREEAMVIVVGGNETTALSMSFTAVMLSRYSDVQDQVYEELKEVFGDSEREVTFEDLSKLKYLEAVIKESLRLYPSVPMAAREVRKDVALPSGVTLVEGTSVLINIWATHRNPSYWGADAELFRPERFLEGPLRHPAQFIPFSYSVRNCIGSTFGMLSMKTVMSNLLRKYKLLPPSNMPDDDLTKPLRVKFDLTLKHVDDFVLRVQLRNKVL